LYNKINIVKDLDLDIIVVELTSGKKHEQKVAPFNSD
jgi:hypothetical protein